MWFYFYVVDKQIITRGIAYYLIRHIDERWTERGQNFNALLVRAVVLVSAARHVKGCTPSRKVVGGEG
jgi:hypothetical protein